MPRYVEWMERDWVFPNIESELVIDAGALACLDAKQGFGQVAGERAVDEGIARAKKHGVSVVGLKNSGHLGRIGDWAERAADAGYVSFHFVNVRGSLLVAPFGGTDRRGSTSPLAIGIPSKGKEHIILDMATSTVAEGKVMVAQKGGKKLHSTQKPESLLHRVLLATTNKNDSILDPFLGTGTTAVVAKKLGRKFYGIEKDKKYFKAAYQRIKNTKVFEDSILDTIVNNKSKPILETIKSRAVEIKVILNENQRLKVILKQEHFSKVWRLSL